MVHAMKTKYACPNACAKVPPNSRRKLNAHVAAVGDDSNGCAEYQAFSLDLEKHWVSTRGSAGSGPRPGGNDIVDGCTTEQLAQPLNAHTP